MADEITVGGITVPITHPDKVLFPADGITKADLATYYADVAGRMLPWLRDRPITMVRYPDGLDGQRFFQKNAPSYFPDWIRRVRVGKEGGEVEHAVCDKPATLVYLANQACIEIHGFTSRVDKLDAPDQVVFDFDPPDGERFAEARRAALWARDLLDDELGLTSFVRTTGGRGLHVHVGLNRRADFEEVREFAHRVAAMLARRHPDAITAEQRKDKRGNRIYADVMRNAYAQTVVASYGVRGRPGAHVATPLNWAEVEDDALQPGQFTIETIRARLDGGTDPWADFAESRYGLGEAAKRLAKLDA
jgi:bifunctional non-homologous end joining protein LigD